LVVQNVAVPCMKMFAKIVDTRTHFPKVKRRKQQKGREKTVSKKIPERFRCKKTFAGKVKSKRQGY